MFDYKNDTFVIIGNGFDMAHGYNTDYESFVKNTYDKNLDIFKSYCENNNIENWYSFEENIQVISNNLYVKSHSDGCDYKEVRKEIAQLKNVFKKIHFLCCYQIIKLMKSG